MPEHVHLVLWVPDTTTIETILRSVKFPMSRKAIAWTRSHRPGRLESLTERHRDASLSYHFWKAGGGHDRNLRSVADVHEKIHYIHANPVRRGLVEHPRDWPWSSWRAWHLGGNEPLRLDK